MLEQDMRKIWTGVLFLVIIALVGVSAYLFGQNQEKEKALQTEAVITPSTQVVIPSFAPTSAASPAAQNSPVVIIESQGSIPAADLSELKLRVVNPYLDYSQESQPGMLVSFKVSPNLLESKAAYPYMADAVFKNGGNEGFLISKNNGHIDWYLPACINGCNFSDSFKSKYPEIVVLTQ